MKKRGGILLISLFLLGCTRTSPLPKNEAFIVGVNEKQLLVSDVKDESSSLLYLSYNREIVSRNDTKAVEEEDLTIGKRLTYRLKEWAPCAESWPEICQADEIILLNPVNTSDFSVTEEKAIQLALDKIKTTEALWSIASISYFQGNNTWEVSLSSWEEEEIKKVVIEGETGEVLHIKKK